jgi:hypothetical protein
VGPRVGLDDLEKRKSLPLPGLELRLLGRPARSHPLYRLCYAGSYYCGVVYVFGMQSAVHIRCFVNNSLMFVRS